MTHADLIELLGDYRDVADDLGLHYSTVFRWKQNGIPPQRWLEIVQLGKNKGVRSVNKESLRLGAEDERYRWLAAD